jgi:hypothetical protein
MENLRLLSCGSDAQLDGMMYGDHPSTVFFVELVNVEVSVWWA